MSSPSASGCCVGLLTGIAAFGGIFLNGNFVLAGVLGQNPALIIMGAFLMVAWRNAGWIGLDRWLLPLTQRTPSSSTRAAVGAEGATPTT